MGIETMGIETLDGHGGPCVSINRNAGAPGVIVGTHHTGDAGCSRLTLRSEVFMSSPIPSDRDRIAEALSRYRIAGEPLSAEDAYAAADRMLELRSLDEAELAARGYRYLTVVHGDVETAEDEVALRVLQTWVDRHPGVVAQTRGTNDQTTWLLAPPAADTYLAALQAVAEEHNPGWWRIRRTAQ
jgi:hypothetical protein